MIDKLISSHLVALATEDRQCVPTLDALWVPPVPRPPRRMLGPWLAPIARAVPTLVVLATAGALFEAKLAVFIESPQLVLALVIAAMALLGLGSRSVKARPLAGVIAAGLFTAVAATSFAVGWHDHMTACAFFDPYGGSIGPCHADTMVTTTWFVVVAFGVVLVIAAVAARWIRWDGARTWSTAAKVVLPTVLLTWVGMIQFMDVSIDMVHFHYAPWIAFADEMIAPHHIRVIGGAAYGFILAASAAARWNAIEAGLVLLALAVSIGVACMRERDRPSRWLSVLESPWILPLGVIVATANLVLASAQWQLFLVHRGDTDDIPWYAAWASVGAVVAYASMLLRRRRRGLQR